MVLGVLMIGQRNRDQLEFMVCGSIRDLLADDHVLVRVDGVLDLSWRRGMVEGLYADGFGRPGVEPEAALRLMLAGFLLGFVQDRRLMREAQVNLAIRWFAGFGLTDRLPDHASLTRIRLMLGRGAVSQHFHPRCAGLSAQGDGGRRYHPHGCQPDPRQCQL